MPLSASIPRPDVRRPVAAGAAGMIYPAQADFEAGREFHADLKERMPEFGRDPDELKLLPGIYTIVGRSAQEAEDRYEALRALVDEQMAMASLGNRLGSVDLALGQYAARRTRSPTRCRSVWKAAADGLNIMPAALPGSPDDFCMLVVPELQRRGLLRTGYTGTTLRDHPGLRRPEQRSR